MMLRRTKIYCSPYYYKSKADGKMKSLFNVGPTPKEVTWEQVTCQRLQLLAMDQVLRSIVQGTAQILGKAYPTYKKEGIRGYISRELHDEYLRYLANKDLTFFEDAFHTMYQHCQEVLSWFEDFSQNEYTLLNENIIKEKLQKIDEKLSLLGGTFVTPLIMEELFERKLAVVLSRLPEDQRILCRQNISVPIKIGFSGVMERELLELCSSGPGEKEMIHFTEKWGWLNLKFYFGKPYDVEDIKARVVSSAIAKERLRILKKEEEEQHNRMQETLTVLNLSPEEGKLIALIQENIYFRTYRLDVTAKIGVYLRPFFIALARLRKMKEEDIGLYNVEELIHNSLPEEELEKRKWGWILTMLDGKIRLITGVVEEQKNNLGAQEVSGLIAHRGIATGHVKIILEKKDLVKVDRGDIIIAEMTYPDYNLALAKAKAIVTDIGGVTCHAAIVSRELNKPCIIGTKIATKVFQDGDLVEVDANAGVVRKL